MLSTLKLNLPELLIVIVLFMCALKLLRLNRVSAHVGVGWLVGLIVLGVLYVNGKWITQILASVGRGDALRGMVDLGAACLAFLVLKIQSKVSMLTEKVKLLDQELALVSEQVRTASTGNASGHSGQADVAVSNANVVASTEERPKSAWKAQKSVMQQIVACLWVGLVVYMFGLYTGDFTAKDSLSQTLASFMDSLQANYLQ